MVLIEGSRCVIKIVLNSHDTSLFPFDFAQALKARGRHIYKYLWWFCSPFLEDACLFSSFKLLTSRLATLARKGVFWHGRPWCTTTNESIEKNVSARKNRNQLKYTYLTKQFASYLIRPILLTKVPRFKSLKELSHILILSRSLQIYSHVAKKLNKRVWEHAAQFFLRAHGKNWATFVTRSGVENIKQVWHCACSKALQGEFLTKVPALVRGSRRANSPARHYVNSFLTCDVGLSNM